MPARKKSVATKRGRAKKAGVAKAAKNAPAREQSPGSDDSAVVEQELIQQQERQRNARDPSEERRQLATELENTTSSDGPTNDTQKIAELQRELQKSERSKSVLYKALVRERHLHNEKPSIVAMSNLSGHNMSKHYSALSADQKKDRLRLLATLIAEFADPKSTSKSKTAEVKAVMESLNAHLKDVPSDFE
ncbi:hypothetical protein M3Y96_00646000 [Aphelenchoides besseyi]|nr:hypothetical protein M3Y96_00646000 [Aphelenchoides besseyi]